jgi:hypothetical protein
MKVHKMPIPGAAATGLNPAQDALAKGSIKGLLNYPYILARRGHTGTVNARPHFTTDSSCDWRRANRPFSKTAPMEPFQG